MGPAATLGAATRRHPAPLRRLWARRRSRDHRAHGPRGGHVPLPRGRGARHRRAPRRTRRARSRPPPRTGGRRGLLVRFGMALPPGYLRLPHARGRDPRRARAVRCGGRDSRPPAARRRSRCRARAGAARARVPRGSTGRGAQPGSRGARPHAVSRSAGAHGRGPRVRSRGPPSLGHRPAAAH